MRRALPALLLLAGCALPERPSALTALVGAREDQLVATLGVPNRTYELGGTSVLGYDLARFAGDPDARSPSVVPPGAPVVPACELTFFVREQGGFPVRSRRVESYAYAGPACR